MKVSSCCGAAVTNPMMLDYGICPDCKDHCEFEDYDSDDDDIFNNFNDEGGIKFTITNKKP